MGAFHFSFIVIVSPFWIHFSEKRR